MSGTNSTSSGMNLQTRIILGICLITLVGLFLPELFQTILVLDIFIVALYIWGSIESCPNCGNFWARKRISRDHLGTHTAYREMHRQKVYVNRYGNETGHTDYTETVPVTKKTIQDHYECYHCGHKWSGKVHDIAA
jgi:hypothetical protein